MNVPLDIFKSEQEAKELIRDGVVSVEDLGQRSLKVKCISANVANTIVAAYAKIYGGYDHVWDSEFHFLGTDKYAEPKFATVAERDRAKRYTEQLIASKESTPIDGTQQNLPEDTDEAEKEQAVGKSGNVFLYIAVGAAVALVVILLWNRKKK